MKKFLIILTILLTLLVVGYFLFLKPNLMVFNGYAAKNLCSCVFVAGMDEDVVKEIDLGFSLMKFADAKVDYSDRSASSSVWGLTPRKAIYRPNLGCVLVNELSEEILRQPTFEPSLNPVDSLINWFENDTTKGITSEQSLGISEIIAGALENDNEKTINTRGMVVLHKGHLVGEGYAEGYNKDSRLLGWSMTKSLTSTMAGLMIHDGYFKLDDKAPVSEWEGTDKETITYRNLLQMSSGLQFEEDYASVSDANMMLWMSDTMGVQTIDNPLEAAPGEKWYYSSGTTNLLMKLMRDHFPDQESYWDYLNKELYNRIGAYSMIIEPDGAGNFVGSSFGWGTPRDWARVGQLYLDSGRWAGVQIVPEEWVTFVQRSPRDPSALRMYGGQFWLAGSQFLEPEDAYFMNGFHSQSVLIIPSKELVIVRMGVDYNHTFDFRALVSEIVGAIGNW